MVLLLKCMAFLLSSFAARALRIDLKGHDQNVAWGHDQVVAWMKHDPSYETQFNGCRGLVVDSSKKDQQDQAAQDGAIDAIAGAMDLFPEDKVLVETCTMVLSTLILFNRENGLRAGQLGCLNHTLHIYKRHMDDPDTMGLGGAIGAYFDYVDENRRIAAELGGIRAIIQNIKNHFHGQYSEWNYNPVKQSLFALSSGCWLNQDICVEEGFPELAVKLMAEHGSEDKIAEETMQVTRALMKVSDVSKQRLADLGMADSMVHVMRVNPNDRGAIDLTCINFAMLVGSQTLSADPKVAPGAFSTATQAKALESGALEEVIKTVAGGQEMHHKEHGAFNFDVDAAYNVNRDCFFALAHLGHENPTALERMRRASLADVLAADLRKEVRDGEERFAGCSLMAKLSGAEQTVKLRACSP